MIWDHVVVGSNPTTQTIFTKVGDRMRVSDAAKHLGMNTQTLRLALQQNKFPFGTAVKTSENRYTYYVNAERLKKYLEGASIT